jgi:hypothetical protein
MDKEEENKKVLCSEWTITEPIRIDDICILESTEQEFLCSKIIPYEQFEFLYFGSFDFKDILFAVQYKNNDKYYVKVLTGEPEQKYAYNVYKEQK